MKKLYILTLIMIFGLGSFAINLTFRVDMSEQTVSPDGVHIAGSFQGWNPAGTEMTNTGNDVYTVTLSITSGEYIQYKFINGIDWTQAELVPEACGVDDGYGGFNRFLTVPQEDTTLTAVCFGSCNPCGYYVEPLISDNWRTHHWPYNAYYPLCSNPNHNHGIVNGHVACSCGPTAVSRLLHYWEFPVQGNGSFSYTDVYGCQYYADFGNTIYEWDKMPYALYETDPEDVYGATATLTYHVATCVNDVNVTGANVEMWITGLTSYLRYSSTAEYVIRSNYTKEEWINIYKTELDNGRPVLVVGGNTGGGGHWFICDGYNEADEFHFIMGWGGNGDDYYDIDDPNGYSLNNKALIKLQPELNGKELALVSPNGGEMLPAGEETDITWDSENVSDIKIDYTLDNGFNWYEITGSTAAGTGTYTWTVPDSASNQCKVKLTDVTDINVYDKSDDVFSITLYELSLSVPNGGEYYIPGNSASIIWENTPVSDIKIEYTTDNGSNWIEITASTSAASGTYDWIIPNTISDQCKVMITDITNGTIYDESDNTFEIGVVNNIGGPYAVDDNTILLLHFEGDLTNQSSLSDDGIPHGDGISFDPNTPSFLGQCLKLDNSNGSSYITIPHNDNLSLTGDWTIEAWFYIVNFGSGASQNPTIISKSTSSNQNYFLWYHDNWGQIKGQYTNTFNTDKYVGIGNIVTSGEWYHIVYIKNSANSTEKLIIHNENRELIAEETVQQNPSQTTPLLNSEDIYIGKLLSTANFYFDGYIDEIRISDVVRNFTIAGEPSNPNPEAGATDISIYTNLSWTNGNNTETIDLYFDTINPPADLVLNNVTAVNFYDPDDLNTETTYYWQIICRNPVGFTEGQVWSFTTEPETGIFNNQLIKELFILYPNPASCKLYLKTKNLESRQIFVEILNINGKVIYGNTISTNTIVPIDTDNIKKGVYFIQLRNEKYLQTKKLIIK